MRSKVRKGGSVLGDLNRGGRFGGIQPTPVIPPQGSESGVGHVVGPSASPGVATAIARSVQQIPFDDSIDGTYPLECFFQMPTRVVEINDIQVWVKRLPFRRYVQTTSLAGGGSNQTTTGGGGVQTSSNADQPHSHPIPASGVGTVWDSLASPGTSSDTPTTGAQQQLHTHAGGATEAQNHTHQVTHAHTVNSHQHSHSAFTTEPTLTQTENALHKHDLNTSHNHSVDTTHNHALDLLSGIFESPLTGTMSLYVADNGVNYGSAVVTGMNEIGSDSGGYSLRSRIGRTAGAKRIRINSTALMRVQVLLVMDLILELGV